jgi:hypothetical protein
VHGHENFLAVAWQAAPRDKTFPGIVFPMHTLAELSEDSFRNFEGGQAPAIATIASFRRLKTQRFVPRSIRDFTSLTSQRLQPPQNLWGLSGLGEAPTVGLVPLAPREPGIHVAASGSASYPGNRDQNRRGPQPPREPCER